MYFFFIFLQGFLLTLLPASSKTAAYMPAPVAAVAPSLHWLTLEEALAKSKKEPKKILIDVYTDWCGWCKKMDKQVYQNPEVVARLNKAFYVVKLNAETRQPITVNGTTYRYQEQYKAHELALSLLKGEMSYPSTVILNEKQQVMQRVPGFLPAKDFLRVIGFFSQK